MWSRAVSPAWAPGHGPGLGRPSPPPPEDPQTPSSGDADDRPLRPPQHARAGELGQQRGSRPASVAPGGRCFPVGQGGRAEGQGTLQVRTRSRRCHAASLPVSVACRLSLTRIRCHEEPGTLIASKGDACGRRRNLLQPESRAQHTPRGHVPKAALRRRKAPRREAPRGVTEKDTLLLGSQRLPDPHQHSGCFLSLVWRICHRRRAHPGCAPELEAAVRADTARPRTRERTEKRETKASSHGGDSTGSVQASP